MDLKKFSKAVILSDLHLGWTMCTGLHYHLLENINNIVDNSELILLNGDIIDHKRKIISYSARELIAQFVEMVSEWRNEGRKVVYIEGNHDLMYDGTIFFKPDTKEFKFMGENDEIITVLHGHSTSNSDNSTYDQYGSSILEFDNYMYTRYPVLRPLMKNLIARLYGFIGWIEDRVFSTLIEKTFGSLLQHAGTIVHGHAHYGPMQYMVGKIPVYRSGSWVSPGQPGTKNSLLVYDKGVFNNMELLGNNWVVA